MKLEPVAVRVGGGAGGGVVCGWARQKNPILPPGEQRQWWGQCWDCCVGLAPTSALGNGRRIKTGDLLTPSLNKLSLPTVFISLHNWRSRQRLGRGYPKTTGTPSLSPLTLGLSDRQLYNLLWSSRTKPSFLQNPPSELNCIRWN